MQKYDDGHATQIDMPDTFWYVPAAHGVGDALPEGHMLPAGHIVLADATPPAHTKPASHRRVGFTVPLDGHV